MTLISSLGNSFVGGLTNRPIRIKAMHTHHVKKGFYAIKIYIFIQRLFFYSSFPSPQVPRFDLFKGIIVDSLIVAAIAYCISLSMAKLFANKYKYKINGTQEMLAQVLLCSTCVLSGLILDSQLPNDAPESVELAQNTNYAVQSMICFDLSQGTSNIFGSFFSCPPSAASMGRTLVQVNVGGKTQMTSLVSAVILVFVLLFIGPLFESLPKVPFKKSEL